MKVALVYDRVNKWGGAERVLLALKDMFPQAPLYTSVYSKQHASWANTFSINASFLQQVPFAAQNHEVLASAMPIAFESFSFDNFDIVISVTSESAKGIITKPQTKHICYCLTPTRYLWSGYNEYFSDPFFRLIAKPAVSYLRTWDSVAAYRPDKMIAISQEVKKRIQSYYKRSAEVIYPPVTLSKKRLTKKSIQKHAPYFLVVSRLVPYKRIDIAIEACNALQLPLKIIGTGVEEKKLRSIAGPTIEFVGSVSDELLQSYYEDSSGLLFPGNEDFGLVMVESLSFGKPVLAYKAGGASEIIKDRITGMFFTKQDKQTMTAALDKFRKMSYNEKDCIRQANTFHESFFQKKFMNVVQSMVQV